MYVQARVRKYFQDGALRMLKSVKDFTRRMKVLGNCLDVEEEDNIPEKLLSFQKALLTCIIAIYWLTADTTFDCWKEKLPA